MKLVYDANLVRGDVVEARASELLGDGVLGQQLRDIGDGDVGSGALAGRVADTADQTHVSDQRQRHRHGRIDQSAAGARRTPDDGGDGETRAQRYVHRYRVVVGGVGRQQRHHAQQQEGAEAFAENVAVEHARAELVDADRPPGAHDFTFAHLSSVGVGANSEQEECKGRNRLVAVEGEEERARSVDRRATRALLYRFDLSRGLDICADVGVAYSCCTDFRKKRRVQRIK